jgi:hypothetical protein
MTPDRRRSNVDQLRADIDRGRTGDKVRVGDPAAAPLGTDDEAAGRPPRAADVERARREETAREVPRGQPARVSLAFIAAALIFVVAVVLVVYELAKPAGAPNPPPPKASSAMLEPRYARSNSRTWPSSSPSISIVVSPVTAAPSPAARRSPLTRAAPVATWTQACRFGASVWAT